MAVLRKYFSVGLAAILLLALLPAPSASAACYTPKRPEKKFKRLINLARTGVDLKLDPELSKAAKVHTREMVRANTLYHTPSDVLRKRVTNWVELGENVGVGGSVTSLHDAFMNSPAHRDNILHASFRYVGVGVIKKDGRMWVTVLFEAKSNPGSPLC